MNHCVPDYGMEDDLGSFRGLFPASNEQKPTPAPDNELVELLWRNGHVVMQSQTNRKPLTPSVCELKQPQIPAPQLKPAVHAANPGSLVQEDETAQWFQYALEDSLEKEFCSEFLCEMPIADTVDASRPNKEVVGEGERNVKCRAIEDGNAFTMPPPKSHIGAAQLATSLGSGGGHVNFSHFSRPVSSGSGIVVGMGESSSIRTVGSSACGSNQVQNQGDVSHTMMSNGATDVLGKGVKEGGPMISPRDGLRASTFDATMTSSSGGSGCSFGRTTGQQSTSNQTNKRKGRDGEESECHSEEAEYESMEANKSTTSARKSRAAEVHNLSERRRRDRINEKMRALQELIPHCNKSDKASMLDEAIEYLKSLQLQLQLMWMGSGMAPMMFPGVHQCMPRVGIGMGHASSMPSINNPMQLSRAPLAKQTMPSAPPQSQMPMCPSPTVNPINFPVQMQNVHLPESYARYFGFPHMQLPPQAMNLYTYGSHMVQQNQTAAVAGSSSLPTSGIPCPENLQNGLSGKGPTSTFY